jgi:CheY-like chemotaxis protein
MNPKTTPTAASPRKRVLVVEDDVMLQAPVRSMFRRLNPNASVDWATRLDAACEMMSRQARRNEPYDLVLTDVFLEGDECGLELIDELWRRDLRSALVVTSGNWVVPTQAARHPFLPKPFSYPAFKACLEPYLSREASGGRAGGSRWKRFGAGLLFGVAAGMIASALIPHPVSPPVLPELIRIRDEAPPYLRELERLLEPGSRLDQMIADPRFIAWLERTQRREIVRITGGAARSKLYRHLLARAG